MGQVVGTLMKSLRFGPDARVARVFDVWDTAVGEVICKNAQPAALQKDVLVVHVSGSAWIQQLRFLQGEMIARVNAALGEDLIRDFKFKVGPL